MRLNLGIRRRLAPLLDNDRARIELANSLLFTLPGSPVIYYGDEIGMGDNIWLEDRDGVRTPMQWSSAPNAGFSPADPGDLYSQPIGKGTYAYPQVNVGAQLADPDSLLNRMRQMIRVRRAHPALGRGGIQFLEPANRAILAYLRTHGDQAVLIVNNLSQRHVTLRFDREEIPPGRLVDLFAGDHLQPAVGDSYHLELEGYRFRWLRVES